MELTKIILLDHFILSEGQNVFEALNTGFPAVFHPMDQFLLVPGRLTIKAHGWKNASEQFMQGSFIKFHIFVVSLKYCFCYVSFMSGVVRFSVT